MAERIRLGQVVEIEDEKGMTQAGKVEKITENKIYVRFALNGKLVAFDKFVERLDI